MHPRLLRPLPCQDHLQGRPVLASHSRAMPLQLLRQSPRDCLPRQEAARHKAIASHAVASIPTPPQQQHESKQEQAIRAAEAVAARFSAQVKAPTAANPYGSLYGNSTAAAPNGDSSTYSTSGVQTAATPAPAHDPVAAARAVAARLAGQMGQSGASYSKSAASAAPGQSGQSAAQDPIAAAQAVAARLAARHGDTSLGGPPSNPYGGSSKGVEGLCMPRACACFTGDAAV